MARLAYSRDLHLSSCCRCTTWFLLQFIFVYVITTRGVMEYCEGETFRAECDAREVVVMTHAHYGRMALGRCLARDYGHVGCHSDVLGRMDAWCSGRRACELRVSTIVDTLRGAQHPCPRDFRSYLEAAYQCLRVTVTPAATCPPEGHVLISLADDVTRGYLASRASPHTVAGSVSCPWRVVARPGQTINFTLLDFGVALLDPYSHVQCQQVYASVKESGGAGAAQICGDGRRVAHAYMTSSAQAEVRLFQQTDNDDNGGAHFLLKFEASGCEHLPAPAGGWVEHQALTARVWCNGTEGAWLYHCQEGSWSGERFTTCPPAGSVVRPGDPAHGQSMWVFMSGTNEFSIVIIASIALVIACAILTVGLVCVKRQRQQDAQRRLPPIQPPIGYYEATPKLESCGDISGGLDGGSPPENDYYRTWQLQRHALPSPPHFVTSSRGIPSPDVDVTSPYYAGRLEHIYETPEEARREAAAGRQYFELDPGLAAMRGPEPGPERSELSTFYNPLHP